MVGHCHGDAWCVLLSEVMMGEIHARAWTLSDPFARSALPLDDSALQTADLSCW